MKLVALGCLALSTFAFGCASTQARPAEPVTTTAAPLEVPAAPTLTAKRWVDPAGLGREPWDMLESPRPAPQAPRTWGEGQASLDEVDESGE